SCGRCTYSAPSPSDSVEAFPDVPTKAKFPANSVRGGGGGGAGGVGGTTGSCAAAETDSMDRTAITASARTSTAYPPATAQRVLIGPAPDELSPAPSPAPGRTPRGRCR